MGGIINRNQVGGRRRRPMKKNSSQIFILGVTLSLGLFLILASQFLCVLFLHDDMNNNIFLRQKQHQQQIIYGRLPLSNEVKLPKYPINHRQAEAGLPAHNAAVYACNNALWRTLETTTYLLPNNETFIFTGDIYDLFIRDSAAQMHTLLLPGTMKSSLSLVQYDKRIERIVSGLILKHSRLIRYDPYANSFRIKDESASTAYERETLGRVGYIATWNYELDSGCYFMRLLYFFYQNFPNHPVLRLHEVKEAVMIMIDVWIAEQRHEDDEYPEGELFDCYHCKTFPYRYNPEELSRDGKGSFTNSSAGLTWSGFRPSDDPCKYGYLVPANMFVVVVLGYMMELCDTVWNDEVLKNKANKLREEIHHGIQEHGIVNHPKYGRIYAYEVDGLGNYLLMDDANVPNLLSMPYLGYEYDEEVYSNTKKFILSNDNPTFHRGDFFDGLKIDGVKIEGIGSPHTSRIPNDIWPMGMIMQALVSDDINEKIEIVELLLHSSDGTNHMHESFNANDPSVFSRAWFCWADSLFAELIMSLSDGCPQISQNYEYLMEGLFEKLKSYD